MKARFIHVVLTIFFLFSFTSCATTYMPLSKVPDAQELGQITASFEKNVKVNVGLLGWTSIGLAGAGGVLMGTSFSSDRLLEGESSFSAGQFMTGVSVAGVGLGLAVVKLLVFDVPKTALINGAAREALLTAARQRYTEDVDVRDIKVTYVRALDRTHLYNAAGVVIKGDNVE